MKWSIPSSKSHYILHADILLNLFLTNDDLKLKINPEHILIEQELKNDLGMDSIQIASLLYELEEKYPHFDESYITRWITIEDILISMSEK